MATYDGVVIGAGHNALTAAFYLARAGRRPLVLEQADTVGGGAKTAEIAPGFLCPFLSHEEHLSARVARDMNLSSLGVEWLPGIEVSSLDIIQTYVAAGYGIGLAVQPPRPKWAREIRTLTLPGFQSVTLGAIWAGKPNPLLQTCLKRMQEHVQQLAKQGSS